MRLLSLRQRHSYETCVGRSVSAARSSAICKEGTLSTLRFDPDTIDQPHLLTIRYSHFCEVARWAMDLSGEPYTEIAYALGSHFEPISLIRSDPRRITKGSYPGSETGQAEERRQHAVPLVCLPGGEVLPESWDILEHYVGRVSPSWEKRFDQELGPASRRVSYNELLDPDQPELEEAMMAGSTDEEMAFWEQAGEVVKVQVREVLGINEEVIARDRSLLASVLDEVSASIPDLPKEPGKSDSTAWWITFASLVGVVLSFPAYGGKAWQGPALDSFGAGSIAWIQSMREKPAARAIAEFYDRFR